MYYFFYPSCLGILTVAGDESHITGLWLAGQKYFQSTLTGPALPDPGIPVLAQARSWLDRYFSGKRPSPAELPLLPQGTAFRKLVWKELCSIPYGQVTTYALLAGRMATLLQKKSMSAQAIGGAVGHNPISIIIPCHRVVGTDNSLTGYAGGIENKIRLLQREGVDTTRFHAPATGPTSSRRNARKTKDSGTSTC